MEPTSASKPRLLFITQKIHAHDDDLAFTILWIQEFIRAGFEVVVICLEKRDFNGSFPVHSLGKEDGVGKIRRILRFVRLITTLEYDRVFVHMNPEYFTLGGWWWKLRNTPTYFWYTHYTMNFHVFLAGLFSTRLFAATPQSLPQYADSPKRVILGHGIDLSFWQGAVGETQANPFELLAVHRLSRSKRLDITLRMLALLPEHRLTIYGRPIDPVHFEELQELVSELGVTDRVQFMGPIPMDELKEIYPRYRVMCNMAYETIDKTMVEGMLFGIYPVTTPGNAKAIGLPVYPQDESPQTLATFIREEKWKEVSPSELRRIVEERHSLHSLIGRMADYIKPGV